MRFFLTLIALFWATSAQAAWRRAESKHFVIYSEGSEKDLTRYAERLEGVHYLMKAATATRDTAKTVKVKVYFVSDVDAVKRLIGRPGSDVAGYYQPGEGGSIAVVPRNAGTDGNFTGEVVLFHEYAHHFMLQYLPAAYPAWFVEGFAEIVSTASFERKGSITYGKAASHRQAEIQQADWIPVQKMIDGSFADMPKDKTVGFYGQSWLMSHYLTFSEKRAGQLRAFVGAINAGQSQADAAKVFGDIAQLQRELRTYAASGVFAYKAPALPADIASETTVTTLSEGEGALIDERIELQRRTGRGTTDAEKAARTAWLAALRAKIARYPADPAALQLLADAECASAEWTACGTTADRVLALAPANPMAMLRKGLAMMQAQNANISAARDWIVKANRAAPDAPEPLIAFYRSYLMEGRAVPDVAVDGLYQAMETVPQESSVRLTLASALIARKLTPNARAVLAPLAYSPHRSGAQKTAQRMLDRLDGKKVDDTAIDTSDDD